MTKNLETTRTESHALAVIGGGVGGMAAAIAAYDAGCRDIVLLETDVRLGGVLPQCIHAGFGLQTFGEELTGPEYAARYADEIKKRQIDVRLESYVTSIGDGRTLTVFSGKDGAYTLKAGAVVLAVGCRERPAGALTMDGPRIAGIMTAGTAQRYINIDGYMVGRRVVILGSGDIGLIMARRLTLEGAEVVCVCELMPWSNGLQRNIVQCLEDFNIPLYCSTTVVGVTGKERVTGVWAAPVDENRQPVREKARFIPCDTLLLSVGLLPETALAADAGLPLGKNGGIAVDEQRRTLAEGVFACGNVVQVHDLADYVAEEGQMAGRSAAAYLQNGSMNTELPVETVASDGISYVVPERLHPETAAELFFRVRAVERNVRIRVRTGETVLKEVRRSVIRPGEMQRIKLAAGSAKRGERICVELVRQTTKGDAD